MLKVLFDFNKAIMSNRTFVYVFNTRELLLKVRNILLDMVAVPTSKATEL